MQPIIKIPIILLALSNLARLSPRVGFSLFLDVEELDNFPGLMKTMALSACILIVFMTFIKCLCTMFKKNCLSSCRVYTLLKCVLLYLLVIPC